MKGGCFGPKFGLPRAQFPSLNNEVGIKLLICFSEFFRRKGAVDWFAITRDCQCCSYVVFVANNNVNVLVLFDSRMYSLMMFFSQPVRIQCFRSSLSR